MRRAVVSRPWSILAVLLLAVAALVPLTEGVRSTDANADPPPRPTATHDVTIDGKGAGRTFDGVGGVSAGGSSRLLVDYPRKEREQILDYLFRPNYGAALDMLKVEIGGDIDATVGAEPSHQRVEGTVQCDRGYEWWLMKQAQRRNPDIAFYGLPWGAPGWFDGGYWSQDRVDYLISWLDCAKRNGFEIDYLGAANESGHNRDVSVRLAEALDANGYGDVQVVGTDNHSPPDYWFVAPELQNDQAYNEAIDILGEHDVCVWRTLQRECHVSDQASELGKPLWDSENSTQDYQVGHEPLARAMNRHYVDGRITGNLNWALISSWYDNFPIGGTGLMIADRPWSGHYEVGPSIWVDAHTTQFTDPGWQYLDGASDYSPAGASYVSLRAPDSGDYTSVIETLDSKEPETFRFEVTGGLPGNVPVQVWSTDLRTKRTGDDFEYEGSIRPKNGTFSFRTEPGHLYTLSTIADAAKGTARSAAGAGAQLDLPYAENFEHAGTDRLARYFSDVHGGFETAPCAGDRDGSCYRQVVTTEPLSWHDHGTPPTTIVGDPRWWGDYEVSADVLLEQAGSVELLGRVDSQQHNAAGYHLSLSDTGAWELYSQNNQGNDRSLASGTTTAPGLDSWHRLTLRFDGDQVTALLDGTELGTVRDDEHTTGQVGLRVGGWTNAQFDNVRVERTAAAPKLVPQSQLTATATSEHAANDFGHVYTTDLAIDGRLWSSWRSEFAPLAPLPQSITLRLPAARTLHGLTYTPSVAGTTGAVTSYNVYASQDGERFTKVGSGNWEVTGGTKTAPFDEPVTAKYVRLEAAEVDGCPRAATVTELNVSTSKLRPLGHGEPPDDQLPDFPNLVPQNKMTASATSQQPGYEASKAIDGDCGTMWHQSFSPYEAPPHSVTLDLGQAYDTTALIYRPRQDNNRNGIVTSYEIAVSSDGQSFTPVANGTWAADDSLKYDEWAATGARYVRFTANEGFNGHTAAAELDIAYAN